MRNDAVKEPTMIQLTNRTVDPAEILDAERTLAAEKRFAVEFPNNPQRLLNAQSDFDAFKSKGVSVERVTFKHTPVISETRTSEYSDSAMPGETGILIYTVTGNRRFTINGKFISRSVTEAKENYLAINLLRGWLLPPAVSGGFGLGAPPVLTLSGYGKQFYNIPVQLSEFNISYPDDIDYITCEEYMVPIIQTVDITIIEARDLLATLDASNTKSERNGIANFELKKYKQGNLPGW
jgi:hypothetical protein